MTLEDDSSPRAGEHSVYIPLLIGLAALVGLLGFQGVELWEARGALKTQREGQNSAMENSEKLRQQLIAVATKTADLAQKGDPDAKAVVDAYAKRGLQFLPTAKPKS